MTYGFPDPELEHSADLYEPTGTSQAQPYLRTVQGFPCLFEADKYAWRNRQAQTGDMAGQVFKLTINPDVNVYDNCRIYWPLTGQVFKLELDAIDAFRDPIRTSISAYQRITLRETQVPHIP
jgi:hypothetical protein